MGGQALGTLPAMAEPLDALRAAVVAGHDGDAATARALADHPDPQVRAAALGALARIGDQQLAATVVKGLGDPSAAVRRRAAEVGAAAAGVPVTAVVAALADPDPLVAEAAAWALGERRDPDAVDSLVHTTGGHPDPLVREAAVAALGAIGDARSLPAVLAATADKAAVRRRAVLALAPFEGVEVEAALQRALLDRDWQVRQAAEDLLA